MYGRRTQDTSPESVGAGSLLHMVFVAERRTRLHKQRARYEADCKARPACLLPNKRSQSTTDDEGICSFERSTDQQIIGSTIHMHQLETNKIAIDAALE